MTRELYASIRIHTDAERPDPLQHFSVKITPPAMPDVLEPAPPELPVPPAPPPPTAAPATSVSELFLLSLAASLSIAACTTAATMASSLQHSKHQPPLYKQPNIMMLITLSHSL